MIDRHVRVEIMREAARAYMEATSGRKAAADIGLSKTGLRAFIAGTDPHPATLRKLTAWHIRTARDRHERITAETAAVALAILTETLPAARRAKTEGEILTILERAIRAESIPPPSWVRALREDVT